MSKLETLSKIELTWTGADLVNDLRSLLDKLKAIADRKAFLDSFIHWNSKLRAENWAKRARENPYYDFVIYKRHPISREEIERWVAGEIDEPQEREVHPPLNIWFPRLDRFGGSNCL